MPIRILVAEDYEPFRRFLLSTLQNRQEIKDIRVVSDGLEAVQEAQSLRPDLVLLDIGLPTLNGIDAARRIRMLSPTSKIIFVTQESSVAVVQEAFDLGVCGYVVKADAAKELLTAITAVLRGERFVGSRFAGHEFTGASNLRTPDDLSKVQDPAPMPMPTGTAESGRHEVQFYSDEEALLDGFTDFIGSALKAGSSVIVLATESHLERLLPRLQTYGIDMTAAIDQRRYLPFGSDDILSRFMVDDMPDSTRLFEFLADLFRTASNATRGPNARIVVCGELAPTLLMQGKAESAIRLEQLWDQLVKRYSLDTLCGYPLSSFHRGQGRDVFQRICAQHSSVLSR